MSEAYTFSPLSGVPYLTHPHKEAPEVVRGPGAIGYALWNAAAVNRSGDNVAVYGLDEGRFKELSTYFNQYFSGPFRSSPASVMNEKKEMRRVFGEYDFAETVGIWLTSGLHPAARLLSPFISTEGFEFTPSEYLELKDRILLTLRKFDRLPVVSKGLEDLNTGFFRHQDFEESRRFIARHVDDYLAKGSQLHQAYLTTIHGYARKMYFRESEELETHRLALVDLTRRAGDAASLSTWKRKGVLKGLQREFESLQTNRGGSHREATATNGNMSLGHQLANALESLLGERENLQAKLREEGQNLGPATVRDDSAARTRLQELSQQLDTFISELDEIGLYHLPLGGTQAATTPRQLLLLEKVMNRLRNTKRHLPELKAFYDRRQFWYAQPVRLRRLMAPLMNLPPGAWEPAFSSWYFDRCLEALPPGRPSPTSSEGKAMGQLVDYTAGRSGPVKLLLDFSGEDSPEFPPEVTRLRLSHLMDRTAAHVSLAGLTDPSLLFVQPFHITDPPDWRCVACAEADPSLGLLNDRGELAKLENFHSMSKGELRLQLPSRFSGEERESLLNNWEKILAERKHITIHHNWTDTQITNALMFGGLTAEFLGAILIRAADAAANPDFDAHELTAIGNELYKRLNIELPRVNPLAEELQKLLRQRLPGHRIALHQPWRDTFLPLVIISSGTGKQTVVLPDGQLPGGAAAGAEVDGQESKSDTRLIALKHAGYELLKLDTKRIWREPEAYLEVIAHHLKD